MEREGREGLEEEGGKGNEIEGRGRGRWGMGKRGTEAESRGKACIGPPPFTNPRYATEYLKITSLSS
jgi:hypothetical protein